MEAENKQLKNKNAQWRIYECKAKDNAAECRLLVTRNTAVY
jgi:hypothetical protein